MKDEIIKIAMQAKAAGLELATVSGQLRSKFLTLAPQHLDRVRGDVLKANLQDIEEAKKKCVPDAFIERLRLTEKTFEYMKKRLLEVAELPDPLGKVLNGHISETGLVVKRVSVPLGVIGIIYEARPNVTTDAASVCIKSGNAVILRGGKEASRTNKVLADAMIAAAKEAGLPDYSIQLLEIPGHEAVNELLKQDQYIDVIIPRGGKSLIKAISRESKIPVIKHYDGICQMYIAEDADFDMAISLAINSKLERVEVCNSLETLLVDAKIANEFMPLIGDELSRKGVEIRGCKKTCTILEYAQKATEEDWSTEYLAPVISVKVVDDIDAAIQHINTYGSGHTDVIVTSSKTSMEKFMNRVDSASVLVNASTRLSGGGAYGLGSVVGISTGKLHARGPVGPDELTSYKWIAIGDGHLRN
ncbi:MAG: glutamate-5-semialdehyde dehydrogenase [Kiritimatiellae bacterium]|jgi:glutamate-5-semialdehyde dehydrogenase|nr:glutamate-5-semialdehyde dehydrogenase [Kiritimatiellia bacterium]